LLDVEKQIDNVIEDIETSFASVFKAEEFIEYELGDDHWKTQISELLTILLESLLLVVPISNYVVMLQRNCCS